jgi:hypothetical protein
MITLSGFGITLEITYGNPHREYSGSFSRFTSVICAVRSVRLASKADAVPAAPPPITTIRLAKADALESIGLKTPLISL